MKDWRTTTAGIIGLALSIIESATSGEVHWAHLGVAAKDGNQ